MSSIYMKNKYVKTLLFDISLFSFFFYSMLSEADHMVFFPTLCGALYLLSVITSLSSAILTKKGGVIRNITLIILTVLAFYFHFYLNYRLMPNILLIIAAANINVEHIMLMLYRAALSSLMFMLIMVFLGLVNNYVMDRDALAGTAYNLGFYHYSGFSLRFIAVLYLYLYINKEKMTYAKILIGIIASIITFLFTITRLQLITCLGIIILYVLYYKLHIIDFRKKIFKYASIVIYPLVLVVYYVISFVQLFVSNGYFDLINEGVNGRLYFTVMAFDKYKVKLFGQKIEMVGARDASGSIEDYFYIDSGYAYWLLALGFVFFVFMLMSYIRIMYKSYKYQDFAIFAIMLIMAFANISNDFFTTFFAGFPLIVLLFADWNTRTIKHNSIKQLYYD